MITHGHTQRRDRNEKAEMTEIDKRREREEEESGGTEKKASYRNLIKIKPRRVRKGARRDKYR